MCSSCSTESHENLKWDQIPTERAVAESLEVAKALIGLIKNNSDELKESSYNKIFNEELKMFNEILSMMDKKVN